MGRGPEVDVARNLRTIEWLKAELVGGVSALFRSLWKGGDEAILEALASVIIVCYLLTRRLGVHFVRLELKLESQLRRYVSEGHELEEWFGDLSALERYWKDQSKRRP